MLREYSDTVFDSDYISDIQVIILDYFPFMESLLNSPTILFMAKSTMHVSHDMPE